MSTFAALQGQKKFAEAIINFLHNTSSFAIKKAGLTLPTN